jgi:serine/threonine protein kinase/formylglycine-generating enzyme required for sulfatase activity
MMSSEFIPLDILQEIDRVCDSFEAAWHAGLNPRIEDYLGIVAESYRESLFREILARELEIRRKAGESPCLADYDGRFGDYAGLIQTILGEQAPTEPTPLLPLASTEPDSEEPLADPQEKTDPNSTLTLAERWDNRDLRSPAPVVVPARIGRFPVVRLLGRGNFLVFLARDEVERRDVAVKVARPGDSLSRRRLMSLAEEAQRLNCLNHPGIVKIYEFVAPEVQSDEQDPAHGGFIVLEYIEGITLEQLLKERPIAPQRLAEILAAVADAVHHAHTAGLVHRDLKPSNIMIDVAGKPRVCDFGLAVDEEIQRLRRGEVAGTLPYMAPEQVRGETNRLDGRTDIWALGIILYRGLAGRLPFRGPQPADYFEQITGSEPRPPRQVSDLAPRELERICLHCLSRQMTDRYLTAGDLAEDLRRWLTEAGREPLPAAAEEPVSPKGLRSFGSEDARAFLSLLPGHRDGDGLPESIAFWKARIEATDADRSFSVGLVYGPSGSGKSSFVKAGLLPQLDRQRIRPILIEASPAQTEAQLASQLRLLVPQLAPDYDLADAIAMLRDDPAVRPRAKLLIVLDQFEQWLQGRPIDSATELVRALRQCDGERVQALLLIRDDFWMATTQLLRCVEVPLVEGQNAAAVELFSAQHARKVLEDYGRSLGQVPSGPLRPETEVAAFLDQAVKGLTGPDGYVIPVRLSLFVEVIRRRPWTVQALRALGGVEGIGVKFLEETFDSASANPAHRLHRAAAEAVLKLLLPAPTAIIRGAPRSGQELCQASGYAERPADFADLLRVLDQDLRLITPVDTLPTSHGQSVAELAPGVPSGGTHYQLAHDYLIRPIRQWLERKEQSTREGRARLRLQVITASWLERPGTHQLPSLFEYAGIVRDTRSQEWSTDERKVIKAATGYYLRRLAAAAILVAAIAGGGRVLLDREDARTTLKLALTAQDRELPGIIRRLVPHRKIVLPEIKARENDPGTGKNGREVAAILLYALEPSPCEGRKLDEMLLQAPGPERVRLILSVLTAHPRYAGSEALRAVLASETVAPEFRLRAACALVSLQPNGCMEMDRSAPAVARALLEEGGRNIPDWLNLLGPDMMSRLVEPLCQICNDPGVHQALAVTAAEALAEISKWQEDPQVLAARFVDCQPDAAQILLRELASLGKPAAAIDFLKKVLQDCPSGPADEDGKDRLARQQAFAAIALEIFGEGDWLWARLRHRADPRLRSLLIDRLAAWNPGRATLMEQLRKRLLERLTERELDPIERQAILMIWAETSPGDAISQFKPEVLRVASSLFRDDPDPAVHSAAELLLCRWQGEGLVRRLEDELRKNAPGSGNPRWLLGPNGHTFAVLAGPLVFRMGSPKNEDGRFPCETLHHRKIDRSIAVSVKEVSIEQFRGFSPAYPPDQRYTFEPSCPVNGISWFQAIGYCNWLSAQDPSIPREEWCYPEVRNDGIVLSERAVERTGYRLPTEAEWEYLCRAGTLTSRSFGASDTLFPRYGWTWLNSKDRACPVGQLLPNELGLFDTLGNLWEWCHDGGKPDGGDKILPYEVGNNGEKPLAEEAAGGPVTPKTMRMLRGGAFDYSPAQARSAHRYAASAEYSEGTFGFRVVRTLPKSCGACVTAIRQSGNCHPPQKNN